MVTASDQTADVLEAFRHQADAYLIKPVHEDRLEGIVERVMPMGELR
jgi:DNA-binding NarL/FixJ family response regulator